MKKVLFLCSDGHLDIRGTSVAMYDYADNNEKLLGNESVILYKPSHALTHPLTVEKFEKRFKLLKYENWDEVDNLIRENKIDVLYSIKGGFNDKLTTNLIKHVVHAVFMYHEPHGSVYAYVSKWLSEMMTSGSLPYVPHMITLPDVEGDLRDELSIPKDAIVIGRHGGLDTFNIDYVQQAVDEVTKSNTNIYFLFVNTPKFWEERKNIIHLEAFSDMERKVKYINTCDAAIHARTQGESFGLSIGEFSIKNKPVFVMWGGRDQAHLDMLGNKGVYYKNYKEIKNLFLTFDYAGAKNKDWDAYSMEYNPAVVMEKFNKVFLQ